MNGLDRLVGKYIVFENECEYIQIQILLLSYGIYWPDGFENVREFDTFNIRNKEYKYLHIEMSNGKIQFGLSSLGTLEAKITLTKLKQMLKPKPKFDKRVFWYD